MSGLAGVPLAIEPVSRKEMTSDQEVRWCPGCGDYAILSTFQQVTASLGIRRENIAVISGIGCSSRLPYYVDSYGMHSIHGRAPAIATGLAATRPDLSVWVVTGDGDALSIGGNHLMHALRRNVNITILLFNNRIYGLTKGQYSPTSEIGKVTKSTPYGSLDVPFNPLSVALGAEASFVARAVDSDRAQLTETLEAAAHHRGSAFIEIFQNCPIFNDGAFDAAKGPEADEVLIRLRHGEPITFGRDGHKAVVRDGQGALQVVETADVAAEDVVVHDETLEDPSHAFALSRLTEPGVLHQAPVGILRRVTRPTYDDRVRDQIAAVEADDREAALASVIAGPDTWEAHER
ncbi:2-oxoacid:ferredoxin oxidoreductase subunit beta [uncultured Tessaracoccus sp.]|uniref:2-oxoacid:ferredoxin oxidoreductase subunit beta n=1 Tax=uncultured Tessaracoccus sp. TaxID=905023 RepID=UPI0025CF2323|nr:2-oxoacid:ferredoxin oxidoreductase subunit beta [uncultured Tessaracoccus sp.]